MECAYIYCACLPLTLCLAPRVSLTYSLLSSAKGDLHKASGWRRHLTYSEEGAPSTTCLLWVLHSF